MTAKNYLHELTDGWQYANFADWWRGTQQSDDMLALLEAVAYPDDRNMRLLACRFVRETRVGVTRTVWDLLTDDRSRRAVVIAEQYAVGDATSEDLAAAEWAASEAASLTASTESAATNEAARAAEGVVAISVVGSAAAVAASAARAAARVVVKRAGFAAAVAQQADIIREMIPVEEIAPLVERYIESK